jgi:hypothetical protein
VKRAAFGAEMVIPMSIVAMLGVNLREHRRDQHARRRLKRRPYEKEKDINVKALGPLAAFRDFAEEALRRHRTLPMYWQSGDVENSRTKIGNRIFHSFCKILKLENQENPKAKSDEVQSKFWVLDFGFRHFVFTLLRLLTCQSDQCADQRARYLKNAVLLRSHDVTERSARRRTASVQSSRRRRCRGRVKDHGGAHHGGSRRTKHARRVSSRRTFDVFPPSRCRRDSRFLGRRESFRCDEQGVGRRRERVVFLRFEGYVYPPSAA